jgi:hypothetical protein
MRKVASSNADSKYFRVMLHVPETNSGVYVYLYTSSMNVPCVADHCYPDVETAQEALAEAFGKLVWHEISDPQPECANNLI